jgi:uncharacterized protein DUF4154
LVWKRKSQVLGLVVAIAAYALSSVVASTVRAQSAGEYELKAVFLYNFAKFVEWPTSASAGTHDIVLGIIGTDPFGEILDQTISGKTVNGRWLVIRRFRRAEDAKDCQIVFISSSEKKRLDSILESLQGAHVLTVGETPGFAQQGGIINFVLEDNRIHFEINVEAADRANLKISSKLLSLAKIVKTNEPRKKG